MVPSLDDIQQAINRMIQLILEVSRGVAQWGQRHLQKSSLKAESGTQQESSAGFGSQGKIAKKGESKWWFWGFHLFLLFTLIKMAYINICE